MYAGCHAGRNVNTQVSNAAHVLMPMLRCSCTMSLQEWIGVRTVEVLCQKLEALRFRRAWAAALSIRPLKSKVLCSSSLLRGAVSCSPFVSLRSDLSAGPELEACKNVFGKIACKEAQAGRARAARALELKGLGFRAEPAVPVPFGVRVPHEGASAILGHVLQESSENPRVHQATITKT